MTGAMMGAPMRESAAQVQHRAASPRTSAKD
jgi:hypothetical protein